MRAILVFGRFDGTMNLFWKNAVAVLLGLIFLSASGTTIGQKVFQPKQLATNSKGILYKYEKAIDVRVHTNGYAVAFNWGKIQNYYTTRYYQLELGFLKDARERRQNKNFNFIGLGSSSDFIFGKQNHVVALRGGLGYKKYLSEKTKRRGVAVGYTWEVGPSLALLKPYYLDLVYLIESTEGNTFELRSEKYTEENADKFLDRTGDIYGSSGFFTAFGDWDFIPGVQGKIALHLSSGAFDKKVRAVEMGILGDLFVKRVPVMVETDAVSNKPFFINVYMNIHFGFRSNP